MPQKSKPIRRIEKESDPLEKSLARSVIKGTQTLRERVRITDLEDAFARKDVVRAMAAITRAGIEDSLVPAMDRIEKAFKRGGRMGAVAIAEEIE